MERYRFWNIIWFEAEHVRRWRYFELAERYHGAREIGVGERFRRIVVEAAVEKIEGARCARDERTRKRAADERTIYRYT